MNDWKTRPEALPDAPAIRGVDLAAFPTSAEADLVDALRKDPAWLPGLSIVTIADGTVAGHALFTRCHVGDAPALCLAPVAVLPKYQRKGAGSAVIRAGLDKAREMGESLVVVLGHPEYYPRFGFTLASGFGIHAPMEVPDDALMALSFAETVPSGTIAYAPPFGL